MRNTIAILAYILLSCLWEVTYLPNGYYLGAYYLLQTIILTYVLNEYRKINPVKFVRKVLVVAIVFSLLKLPYEIAAICGFKLTELGVKVLFCSVTLGIFIIVSIIYLHDKRSS